MSEKFTHPRRRHRRAGAFATLAMAAAMLVTSLAAAPAQADQTVTAWIPLRCAVAGSIPAAVGAALTTTVPDSVTPGEEFNMVDTSTITIFPNSAQQSAGAFGGDAVQGVISDFETNLTNASSAFATTAGGNPVNSSPTQFNAVGAVQPPNQPAVAGPSGPRINGGDTTRGGFQPATPAETFSFGDVPADTSGNTPTEYGPTPGVGGGPNPTDGTGDTLPPVGPLTATGAVGDTIVIQNKNPGGTPPVPVVGGPRVVADAISFHQPGDTYTGQLPADCAYDTRPPDTTPPNIGGDGSVPKPVASWVDQIEIPIVEGPAEDGVGSASARGTDSDASATVPGLGTFPVTAQYSAITNCDEAQNTRPFIVRALLGAQQVTVTRTSTDTSTCTSEGSTSVNEGTGTGTASGALTGSATISWRFEDSPDNVTIDIVGDTGAEVHVSGAPEALNGTPGGVWVFGTLPWPSSGP